ncbi:hypothetical protein [Mycobacterium sp. GA-1285]|uniref:hypothetical protein n=1 Tax=Mycobacterium sp. GA-1285 TaxID=1772282 RepID=UPI000ADD53A4|nr:hypothetical protein [Mycobacterium sp. GA-1285]
MITTVTTGRPPVDKTTRTGAVDWLALAEEVFPAEALRTALATVTPANAARSR